MIILDQFFRNRDGVVKDIHARELEYVTGLEGCNANGRVVLVPVSLD